MRHITRPLIHLSAWLLLSVAVGLGVLDVLPAAASAQMVAAEPGAPVVGGRTSPDGAEEIQCDLPSSECKKNVGGRDGAGLCVFTSIEYAARWQNEPRLFNFQLEMTREPGGGYPEKVDQMIAKYGAGAQYVQSTTGDLELLRAALRSGRGAGITYMGFDPHYGNARRIYHMVFLAHLSERWFAIIDNNWPNEVVWMSVAEGRKRWGDPKTGDGWCVILLLPGPPAPPRN